MVRAVIRPILVATLIAAVITGGVFYGALRTITDTSEDW